MKRLLIVYNPRSSHHETVTKEVLGPARKLKGWMVGKYEIKVSGFEQNVAAIKGLVNDGDLVIAAGGDGTAAITANALMQSGKDVVLAVLGYGNFNDIAGMLRIERPIEYGGEYVGGVQEIIEAYETGRIGRLYPLEVKIDGELWRYAVSYVTLGLLAEATEIFDQPEVRKDLKTGTRGPLYSLVKAVWWYLRNRRRKFLPADSEVTVKRNGMVLDKKTTDYIAMNGPKMAQLMKSRGWWQERKEFGSAAYSLGGFWKMVRFGLKSITKGVPLLESEGDVIEFETESEIEMQAEGEYRKVKAQKISVKKTGKAIRVVLGR